MAKEINGLMTSISINHTHDNQILIYLLIAPRKYKVSPNRTLPHREFALSDSRSAFHAEVKRDGIPILEIKKTSNAVYLAPYVSGPKPQMFQTANMFYVQLETKLFIHPLILKIFRNKSKNIDFRELQFSQVE